MNVKNDSADSKKTVLFPVDWGNRYGCCAWAKVLPEHVPFLSRFQWRLVDGIAVARVGLFAERPHPQSKLTDKLESELCGLIRDQLTLADACDVLELNRTTVWIQVIFSLPEQDPNTKYLVVDHSKPKEPEPQPRPPSEPQPTHNGVARSPSNQTGLSVEAAAAVEELRAMQPQWTIVDQGGHFRLRRADGHVSLPPHRGSLARI